MNSIPSDEGTHGAPDLSATVLAVPNCSEGADPDILAALADACRVQGAHLLDQHSDADHDRTVLTLAGHPMAVHDALFALAEACVAHIDVRRGHGMHPRIGALDVVPLVRLSGDGVLEGHVAHAVAERIGEDLGVPVFLYGELAVDPERTRPHHFRREGLEGLARDLDSGALIPDYGPRHAHPTAGCCLVGVRGPLVAWNVWLPEASVIEARAIADRVREAGGGLPGLRALGRYLPGAGMAQLSMNIEDPRLTPPAVVMRQVRLEADRLGVRLGDSELVGLVQRDILRGPAPAALGLTRFTAAQVLEARCPALRNTTPRS